MPIHELYMFNFKLSKSNFTTNAFTVSVIPWIRGFYAMISISFTLIPQFYYSSPLIILSVQVFDCEEPRPDRAFHQGRMIVSRFELVNWTSLSVENAHSWNGPRQTSLVGVVGTSRAFQILILSNSSRSLPFYVASWLCSRGDEKKNSQWKRFDCTRANRVVFRLHECKEHSSQFGYHRVGNIDHSDIRSGTWRCSNENSSFFLKIAQQVSPPPHPPLHPRAHSQLSEVVEHAYRRST